MKKVVSAVMAVALCSSFVCSNLADTGFDFQEVFAISEYDVYKPVLEAFVNLHGIPQNIASDDFGNNVGTFCRLIDFNNDGISELYLADSDDGITQVYALVDDVPTLVHENSYFNPSSIDDFEGVIHHIEDNQYYIYDYEWGAGGSVLHWYAFNGTSFEVKNQFVFLNDSGEFDSTGYTVVHSWSDEVLLNGFEMYPESNSDRILFRNYGCGSMWFSAYDAFSVSSETYTSIIKNTEELSESELKAKLEEYGTVSAWEYHDYNNDGKSEAFAFVTTLSGTQCVYFISSNGNIKLMPTGFVAGYLYENTARYVELKGHGFFLFDYGAGGSGFKTYLYSVKDGESYELDASGNIQGFYKNENTGKFFTTINDFSNGIHEYIDYDLIYDEYSYQFSIGERLDGAVSEDITSGKCGDNAYWSFDKSTGTLTISGTGSVTLGGKWSAYNSDKDKDGKVYIDENGYCNLKYVIIEEGITELHRDGSQIFGADVESISLPSTLTYIDDWYFGLMEDGAIHNSSGSTFALKEVTIPESVTYIGEHAFNSQFCGNGSILEYYDNFTIKGYTGSAAQTYATENNIKFVALDVENPTIPDIDNLYEKYFIEQHLTNHFEENDVWYRSYGNAKGSNPLNETMELMEFDVKHGALRSNVLLDKEKSFFDLNTAEFFSNPIDTKSVYFTLLSRFVSESYSEEEMTASMAESLRYTITDINTKLLDKVTTSTGIVDSLNSIAGIVDKINESTTFVELTKYLDEAGTAFNALGITNSVIQGVFEGYTNIKDYLEYTTYYKMFANLDNSIHETFRLIKDNTDDKELIAVLNEYIGVLESTDKDNYIKLLCALHTIGITDEETKKTISAIRGDIANGYIASAATAVPGVNIVAAVWVGARLVVTIENLVVDHIMNTDEYYEKFATIVACNVMHRALYGSYNDYIKTFKNNPTMENANVIHTVNKCYMSTDILAIENAKNYINMFIKNNMFLHSGMITSLYFYYQVSEILWCDYKDAFSELNKINSELDSLSEKYSDSSCCIPKEIWEFSVAIERYFNETFPEQWNNLTDEVIEAWNQKKNKLIEKWKSDIDVILVSCPVSVKVYDGNNQEIAYLSDTETKVNPIYSQFFFTCAETSEPYQKDKTDYLIESTKGKVLILPHDSKEYHFEIIGTDDGIMNITSYYVNDISVSDWFNSNNINYSFEDVSVTNTSSFKIEKENDKYSLVQLADNITSSEENNTYSNNSQSNSNNSGSSSKQNTSSNSTKSSPNTGDNISKTFASLAVAVLIMAFSKKRNKTNKI